MQLYQDIKQQDKNTNSESACNGLGHLKIETPNYQLRDKNARISFPCTTSSHFKITRELDLDENSFIKTVSEGYRKFAERREKATIKDEESAQSIEAICHILERLLKIDHANGAHEVLV